MGRKPGALTLSEDDRRVLAVWAADCAERTLSLFEAQAPDDTRPRDAINGLRAFARGEMRIGPVRAPFGPGACGGSEGRRPGRSSRSPGRRSRAQGRRGSAALGFAFHERPRGQVLRARGTPALSAVMRFCVA
jgi:hypothetical protein